MQLSTFDVLLHLGDYDYECSPDKYFNKILDSKRKYQFMGVLGNHDVQQTCPDDITNNYLQNVYKEMTNSKNNNISCEFSDSKFMWSCVYKNMRVIGLTPFINGADIRTNQMKFLKRHLLDAKEDWKICAWHHYDKNYHTEKYQKYSNMVSEDNNNNENFYDYCKKHGAIIFNGHDYVYARSHVMSKFNEPIIDKYDLDTGSDIVQIRDGATFNILNGVGGWEISVEQENLNFWQKKYARGSKNVKRYGGLFCKFNYGGNKKKAFCQFLRINSKNKVFDEFYIYKNENPKNVTYYNIDNDFINEKITAYKIEHNLIKDKENNSNVNNTNLYNTDSIIIDDSNNPIVINDNNNGNIKGNDFHDNHHHIIIFIKNILIICGGMFSIITIVVYSIIIAIKQLKKSNIHQEQIV